MRPGRLVLLAVTVLLMGAFIWFYERHGPTTDELAERKDKVFPALEAESVRQLVIENSHGRFELVKEGDEWKVVAPLADEANGAAITSLLSSLTGLKAERTLARGEVNLEEYGLADPTLSVTIIEEGGGARSLEVGDELPLGPTRAATTADGGEVYLISKWVANELDKDLASWRSTDLTNVLATEVASLTLRDGEGRVALARTGGRWTLTEPIADLADQQRPQDLLGDLNSARIEEFVDQPGDLAPLGFEPPRVEITIVRGDDKPPVQLAFGTERDVDGGKQVACRRGERVFWVSGSATAHVTGDPATWRSTKLVKLDTWSADKLQIEAGGAGAVLLREDGTWKAADVEVDGDAVSRRLRGFADLEVIGFNRPKPAGDPLGHATVTLGDGSVVEATFFPGAVGGEAVAMVPGRAGWLAVDATRVGELIGDPTSLSRPTPTPTPEPTPAPAATPTASADAS